VRSSLPRRRLHSCQPDSSVPIGTPAPATARGWRARSSKTTGTWASSLIRSTTRLGLAVVPRAWNAWWTCSSTRSRAAPALGPGDKRGWGFAEPPDQLQHQPPGPGVDQVVHEAGQALVVLREGDPRGQHHLPALEELRDLAQIDDVHPPDGLVQPPGCHHHLGIPGSDLLQVQELPKGQGRPVPLDHGTALLPISHTSQ